MGIDSNVCIFFTDENDAVVKKQNINSYKCKSVCESLKIPSDATHVRICYTFDEESCDEGCKFESDDDTDDDYNYHRKYYDLNSGNDLDFNDSIHDFHFSVYKLENDELILECNGTCGSKIEAKLIFSKNLVATNENEYPDFESECETLKKHHDSNCSTVQHDKLESNGFVFTGKRNCSRNFLYKCKDCNVHVAIGDLIPKHKENCNQLKNSRQNQ